MSIRLVQEVEQDDDKDTPSMTLSELRVFVERAESLGFFKSTRVVATVGAKGILWKLEVER